MTPFKAPDVYIQDITTDTAASVLAESNDLCLIIDADGIIRDVAIGNEEESLSVFLDWIDTPWIDTVTSESLNKIKLLLADPDNPDESRWRQVNHPMEGQADLPILYKTLRYGDNGHLVAVGRDLRPMTQIQQRLLDVQHSLERDYTRLHQAETRYRMLFSLSQEAILIIDSETNRIMEANPAAGKLLDRPPKDERVQHPPLAGEQFPGDPRAADPAARPGSSASVRRLRAVRSSSGGATRSVCERPESISTLGYAHPSRRRHLLPDPYSQRRQRQ